MYGIKLPVHRVESDPEVFSLNIHDEDNGIWISAGISVAAYDGNWVFHNTNLNICHANVACGSKEEPDATKIKTNRVECNEHYIVNRHYFTYYGINRIRRNSQSGCNTFIIIANYSFKLLNYKDRLFESLNNPLNETLERIYF